MNLTLIGHGYIGTAIAKRLDAIGLGFVWYHHNEPWTPCGGAIINAAGYTGRPNVDACEDRKADCLRGNVIWPLEVQRRSCGLPVVHISSGCVYDGYEKEWTEEDPPNFNFTNGSFYSGSKALAQEALMPFMDRSYLLRIRMPFDSEPYPKNYLTKIAAYTKLIDVRNSLSRVSDVVDVALHFAFMKPQPGIYNVCNPGSITTRIAADMMGLRKEWFTAEEFKAAVKAPRSNCVLSTAKLQKVFPIEPVMVALKRVVLAYNDLPKAA
jgi:dTDP-4-dehydrorhamnose reductase